MTRQGVRARGGSTGVAQRGAGRTRRALMSSDARNKRGNPSNKKNQNTKAGEPEETGPRGRRGKQGANEGTKVHFVSRKETPCR